MYTDQDISTLARIKELSDNGLTQADIETKLPIVQDKKELITNSLALIPSIAQELESIKDHQNNLLGTIEKLQSELIEEKERSKETEKQLQDQIQKLSEKINKPWWKKITG